MEKGQSWKIITFFPVFLFSWSWRGTRMVCEIPQSISLRLPKP
jgi:hypothetical protein